MSELIDLDKATVPDIRFRLNGQEYTAPGELTVEQMLRWIRIQEGWRALSERSAEIARRLDAGESLDGLPDDVESPDGLIVESKREVIELLRERQPSLEDLPLRSSQIGTVFAAMFGRYEAEDEPDPTRPTPKRARKPKS